MHDSNIRDWTGNKRSTFATLGASNHSEYERAEHDYYATDPKAIDALLSQTNFFSGVDTVWECAAGGGHLALRMQSLGINVVATDLYAHGYCADGIDFLSVDKVPSDNVNAIVTNPPYKYALEFCQKCADLGIDKFAMFLKLTFLEGQKRWHFFNEYPPRYVAVFSNRVQVARNADPEMWAKSSAACYAWFIWEKGYKGKPEVIWLRKEA